MSAAQFSGTFSPAAEAEFKDLVGRYPTASAALIPALMIAQREFGWLSPEVLAWVAGRLDVPPVRAQEVATFYTMFLREPPARHHVQVCTNIACALRGGDALLQHCAKSLGLQGRTGRTADGRVQLSEIECMGSCGTAPAMDVDGRYHENLDLTKADKILGGLS